MQGESGGGASAIRRYVYDSQGRMIGEYGTGAADVKGEYVYLHPDAANDNDSPHASDDGQGGYGLLAVMAPDAAAGNAVTAQYVHTNHLGAPMFMTNESGAVTTPGAYAQPVFPGQIRTRADLYHNRYRDYDPTTGRYIQADPIGLAGGNNPYLYANGNPMRYKDPTGESAGAISLCATPASAIACAGAALAVGGGYLLWKYYAQTPPRFEDFSLPGAGKYCPPALNYDGDDTGDNGYGGGVSGDYPQDRNSNRCQQEWAEAIKVCEDELSKLVPNLRLTGGHTNPYTCAKGLVSRKCGGNRPDYEFDPKKPKFSRPKNWKRDD